MTDHANEITPLRSVANVDGRRRQVREYRRMRERLLADLASADAPATLLACIETLAMSSAIQRSEFRAFIKDPSRDPSRYIGLSNSVIGAARTLGIKRIPKAVSLADYLEAREEHAASASTPPRKGRQPKRGNANGA